MLNRFLSRMLPKGPSGAALVLDVSATVAATVLIGVLSIITGVLQARLLGPSGRGQLAAIQAWPGVFAAVAMLGVQDAIVFFGARDPEHAGRYAVSGTVVILTFSLPCAICCW